MNINLAVIYTEYQLLQVESLVSQFKLSNVVLLIHNKNNRIPDWLIDHALFDTVIQLPITETKKSYKLSRKYVQHYCSVISKLLERKNVNILIGAQDENTIFAIIKYYAKPRQYWNIEDGSANYLRGSSRYKLRLLLKKTLFSLYGYRYLDIRFGHGLVKSDKAFRLYPKLSLGRKDCTYLGDVLSNYLKEKVEKIRPQVKWVEEYNRFDTLVVTELSFMSGNTHKLSPKELYKFHPEDKPDFKNITYIKERIPLEFLPLLLPAIKTIRFETPSSSILNILVLKFILKVQINYTPPNKAFGFYTKNLIKEFGNKIEVIPC